MKKSWYANFVLALAVLIGVLITYHFKLSLTSIWPTNNGWLFQGDWAQHYLSWEMFRAAPWQWPLGAFNTYFYPLTTNIGYTDAIPLLAFIFKLLSPLLPVDFQYIGLWLLSCFLLQAVFAMLLLRALKLTHPVSLFVGTMLFVLSPVLLFRIGHPALCAQWLIVASLWVYFAQRSKIAQIILLSLSAFIHPYLTVIVFAFTIMYFFRLWIVDKSIRVGQFVVWSSAAVIIIVLSWYVIGYFSLPTQDAWETGGAYTAYATNLLGLINPLEYSTFLPNIPLQVVGQREGFAYLGLGMLLLVAGLIIKSIIHLRKSPSDWKQFLPLIIIAVGFTIFSLSNTINFANVTLFSYPLLPGVDHIAATFRAAGRFIWVLYYLIFVGVFYLLGRLNLSRQFMAGLLVVVLLIQIIDLAPLIRGRQLVVGQYQSTLSSNWNDLVQNKKVLILYPPFRQDYLLPGDYVKFVYLAHQHHLAITTGYLARYNTAAYADYLDKTQVALYDGQPEKNALYITTPDYQGDFQAWLDKNLVKKINLDGYVLFIN